MIFTAGLTLWRNFRRERTHTKGRCCCQRATHTLIIKYWLSHCAACGSFNRGGSYHQGRTPINVFSLAKVHGQLLITKKNKKKLIASLGRIFTQRNIGALHFGGIRNEEKRNDARQADQHWADDGTDPRLPIRRIIHDGAAAADLQSKVVAEIRFGADAAVQRCGVVEATKWESGGTAWTKRKRK